MTRIDHVRRRTGALVNLVVAVLVLGVLALAIVVWHQRGRSHEASSGMTRDSTSTAVPHRPDDADDTES